MAPLASRNIDVSPEDPVEEWPLEAVQTALERGSLSHWRRLAQAIRAEPWGGVARAVEEVLAYSRPYGVAPLMERVTARAREEAQASEREAVAADVRGVIEASGLTRAEFASRIGTSTSRLSTYTTGKVTPSAAMLVRMRRAAERERAGRALLSLPPPPGEGPEPNWETQKREMRDSQPDPHDIELAEDLLGLTPVERLRALKRYARLNEVAQGD